jgi:hypothetical protein
VRQSVLYQCFLIHYHSTRSDAHLYIQRYALSRSQLSGARNGVDRDRDFSIRRQLVQTLCLGGTIFLTAARLHFDGVDALSLATPGSVRNVSDGSQGSMIRSNIPFAISLHPPTRSSDSSTSHLPALLARHVPVILACSVSAIQ